MRTVTALSYFLSLLSFGMGYSKILVCYNELTNPIIASCTTDLLLAVSFLLLTIFFAVIGFILYNYNYIKYRSKKNSFKRVAVRKIKLAA